MVAFIQSYGLWFALALVFIAMHLFGRGCCCPRDRRRESQAARRDLGESPRLEKAAEVPSKPTR